MNDAHRKLRLNHLISTDYGRQVDFVRVTNLGKARVSQMAGAKEPFGEEAARRLAQEIGLHEDWFNHTWPTPKEERLGIAASYSRGDAAAAEAAPGVGAVEVVSEVDRASTYGERLQQAMNAARKEHSDVAVAIGVTVQALSRVINGKGNAEHVLSARANALAAKFLQVDANWLALGDGPMRAATDNLGSLSHDAIDIARSFDRLTNKIDRELAYSAAIGIFMKKLSDRTVLQNSNHPVEEANPAPIQSDPAEKLHA